MDDSTSNSFQYEHSGKSFKPLSGNKLSPASPEQVRHHISTVYKLSPEKIDDFLQSLGSSLETYLDEADEAVVRKNYIALAVTAHGLKGALLNLGLEECAAEARAIELGAKANDVSRTFVTSLSVLRELLGPLM